ncbi:hypothetical protein BURKHO8Y_230010 [Burkholderia sp. 8Y]|nr:hypothetical protein BURKHO8Y_230010 [Burkholderia sp. 8Y]
MPRDGYGDVSVDVIAASAYSLHSEPQKSVTSSSSETITTVPDGVSVSVWLRLHKLKYPLCSSCSQTPQYRPS